MKQAEDTIKKNNEFNSTDITVENWKKMNIFHSENK